MPRDNKFQMTLGFSFPRFLRVFSRTLELVIMPCAVINLLWVFVLHRYTDSERMFDEGLWIFVTTFALVQLARVFVEWRSALFALGRFLIYSLAAGFAYL